MSFALVSSVALYSCVPHIEEDLASQGAQALGEEASPKGWASVEVDGQQLALVGNAPDVRIRDRLLQALEDIPGVTDVRNQTVLKTGGPTPDQLDSEKTGLQSSAAKIQPPESITVSTMTTTEPVKPPADDPTPTPADQIADQVADQVADQGVAPATSSATEESVAEVAPEVPIEIPAPVIPADLPPEFASCQSSVNALLSGSSTFFGSGSSEVAPESLATVQRIADALKRCGASIEVAGHTDDSGRAQPNQHLSQARADAIRAALVSQGVNLDKVSAMGYGESVPLVSNKTPEGRRINRRIEIKVHKPVVAATVEGNGT